MFRELYTPFSIKVSLLKLKAAPQLTAASQGLIARNKSDADLVKEVPT